MSVKIQWLGHACFKLTFDSWEVVLDPYENGSVEGLDDLQVGAMAVMCSHGHHDHNAEHLVKINRMFAPMPEMKEVSTFHDDVGGTKRGNNIVRVFTCGDITLAHFGDLGHVLTDEQVEQIGKVDIALMPVGGFFTIDSQTAKQVAQQVGAKTVIPMHYRTDDFGFGVLSKLEDFTSICDSVVCVDGDTVTFDKNVPVTTMVLKPAFLKK